MYKCKRCCCFVKCANKYKYTKTDPPILAFGMNCSTFKLHEVVSYWISVHDVESVFNALFKCHKYYILFNYPLLFFALP